MHQADLIESAVQFLYGKYKHFDVSSVDEATFKELADRAAELFSPDKDNPGKKNSDNQIKCINMGLLILN
jgi:hypothetical protein